MNDISAEFRELIDAAAAVSQDIGELVREVLEAGLTDPLSQEEARTLLSRVVTVMREHAMHRQDSVTAAQLDNIERLVSRVEDVRSALRPHAPEAAENTLELHPHNGILPRPVRPTPVFHQRQVPVIEGFVRTRDIKLWAENQRIDIHLNQFFQAHGRSARSDELLEIMLGKMTLPGLNEDDQFEIFGLARSIAANGVRKPPILDRQGNLLDGNRRVTACYYILNSQDFSAEQKKRAEWIQVWQLTDHATEEDREAVIVSLNFEPDHKQEWPKYVKARKVYEYWQSLLALEGRANPSPARQREIRREIAARFAIPTDEVTKSIGMVELASDFEEYHVIERKKDKFAVKHKAEKKFEYFDELLKGRKNGVLASLNDDESFKGLVYDLLYEEKFRNWNQIRELKAVASNDDSIAYFREAREESDGERARKLVEDGIALARASREIERTVGNNKRVEIFTTWLENAPVRIFRPGSAPDALTRANLERLYRALKLVESYVAPTEADAPPPAEVVHGA